MRSRLKNQAFIANIDVLLQGRPTSRRVKKKRYDKTKKAPAEESNQKATDIHKAKQLHR